MTISRGITMGHWFRRVKSLLVHGTLSIQYRRSRICDRRLFYFVKILNPWVFVVKTPDLNKVLVRKHLRPKPWFCIKLFSSLFHTLPFNMFFYLPHYLHTKSAPTILTLSLFLSSVLLLFWGRRRISS